MILDLVLAGDDFMSGGIPGTLIYTMLNRNIAATDSIYSFPPPTPDAHDSQMGCDSRPRDAVQIRIPTVVVACSHPEERHLPSADRWLTNFRGHNPLWGYAGPLHICSGGYKKTSPNHLKVPSLIRAFRSADDPSHVSVQHAVAIIVALIDLLISVPMWN